MQREIIWIFKIGAFFLSIVLSISCNDVKKEATSLDSINLDQYQKNVLSPIQTHRDVYNNAIRFSFLKYKVPFIRDGKITVEEKSNQEYRLLKELHFQDSLLIRIKEKYSYIDLKYNAERQLTKFAKSEFRYKNGKLSETENDVTIHTFEEKDHCTIWIAKDKGTPYIQNSFLCFDEDNRIILDRSNYTLDDRNITEEHITNYEYDSIVIQNYIEVVNNDTTSYVLKSSIRNKYGLINKILTTLVDKNTTFEENYTYLVLDTDPLIINKIKSVDGQKKWETKFTFNKKKQLIEYEEVGEYGDKYRISYDEK